MTIRLTVTNDEEARKGHSPWNDPVVEQKVLVVKQFAKSMPHPGSVHPAGEPMITQRLGPGQSSTHLYIYGDQLVTIEEEVE